MSYNIKLLKLVLLLPFIPLILSNYITLPINYIINESYVKDDIKSIFKYYSNGKLITNMNIGSEKMDISFHITFDYFSTVVLNSSLISEEEENLYYNPNKSNTHIFLNNSLILFRNEPAKSGYLLSDNFIINSQININLNFLLSINEKNIDNNYNIIGLGVNNMNNYEYYEFNFINQLKKKSLISEYSFTMKIDNNNNKGELIIGEYLDQINSKKYNKLNRIEIPVTNLYYSMYQYYLTSYKIISNDYIIDTNKNLLFDINLGFIEGSDDYKEFVENNFFSKEPKCHLEKGITLEEFYICDKDTDISKIPNLIFEINLYNFNITFNSKDLFELINDKLFFIVIFKVKSPINWKIGFYGLKHFLITYNSDKKTISFYKDNLDNNKGYGIILWIAFIGILIMLVIVLGGGIYFFINKNRKKDKKRANELDDEFVYDSKDNNNSNKNDMGI